MQAGSTVRLAEDASARIYTSDGRGGWVASPNRVKLPLGWYCSPPATRPR